MKSRAAQPTSTSFAPAQSQSTQGYQATSLFNPKYSFDTQSSVPPPTDSGNAISNPSAQSISSIPYSNQRSSLSQLPDPLSVYGQSLPSLKVNEVAQTSAISVPTESARTRATDKSSSHSALQNASSIPRIAVPEAPSGNSSDLPPPSIIETTSVRMPQPIQTSSSTTTREVSAPAN